MLGMGVEDGMKVVCSKAAPGETAAENNGLPIEPDDRNRWSTLGAQLRTGVLVVMAAGFLAACGTAGPVQKSKFSPKKYGVKGSPKVVAEGKPVPKGGGRYIVGKKYKIAGKWYYPKEDPKYKKVGLASWYGPTFHGRKTANGEIFDRNALTAAHTTMPLPSYAKVTNLNNGRSMIVRVNDRGPFHGNRVIDLSERVATMLDTKSHGVAKVKVEYVGRARMDGHDEAFLMASYSGPGAVTPGGTVPGTLMAQATPPTPVFGPAPAPAPRPYGGSVLLASAANTGSTYQVAYDPALAFESSQSTIAVASLNTFSQSNVPQAAPVPATAYSPQPAAYAEPAPAGAASGTLGVLRVPAAGTPRNLLSGSAVSSYSANNRINAAYDAVSGMAAGSVPLSRLARNGN